MVKIRWYGVVLAGSLVLGLAWWAWADRGPLVKHPAGTVSGQAVEDVLPLIPPGERGGSSLITGEVLSPAIPAQDEPTGLSPKKQGRDNPGEPNNSPTANPLDAALEASTQVEAGGHIATIEATGNGLPGLEPEAAVKMGISGETSKGGEPADADAPSDLAGLAAARARALSGEEPPGASTSRLNSQTNNLNVLFLGVEGERLLMAAVYSINYQDRYQSAALFFPVNTLLQEGSPAPLLSRVYQSKGPLAVRDLLADALQVNMAYYVRIDRRVLDEVEKLIEPLEVDGETIPLRDLFTLAPGPRDAFILGELLRQLTRPRVYFLVLPRLVTSFSSYLETDFPLNLENLLLHYRIARGVDTTAIPKVIMPGRQEVQEGEPVWLPDSQLMPRLLAELTGGEPQQP